MADKENYKVNCKDNYMDGQTEEFMPFTIKRSQRGLLCIGRINVAK